MFNFPKVSSLAIALTLVSGVGLANVASATAASASTHNQAQQLAEGGADRLQELRERSVV
ncbi:hypothetical protein ACN079_05605 [Pseudomonas sp. ABY48]|uniref:hypothetical protein n=1 Tax=Pseudomonas sp. ABY48 TaxID=3402865 RepID=UPI003B43944D